MGGGEESVTVTCMGPGFTVSTKLLSRGFPSSETVIGTDCPAFSGPPVDGEMLGVP
jgi:hypothetical protein